MKFDTNGYLFPYSKLEFDIDTLKQALVDDIPSSITRKQLFEGLLRYREEFFQEIDQSFSMDGRKFYYFKTRPN